MATKGTPKLSVRFYRESSGSEPVRDWLKGLPKKERKTPKADLDLTRQRFKKFRSAS